MVQVNQAIGRVKRNEDDFGCIFLVDQRYRTNNYCVQLLSKYYHQLESRFSTLEQLIGKLNLFTKRNIMRFIEGGNGINGNPYKNRKLSTLLPRAHMESAALPSVKSIVTTSNKSKRIFGNGGLFGKCQKKRPRAIFIDSDESSMITRNRKKKENWVKVSRKKSKKKNKKKCVQFDFKSSKKTIE